MTGNAVVVTRTDERDSLIRFVLVPVAFMKSTRYVTSDTSPVKALLLNDSSSRFTSHFISLPPHVDSEPNGRGLRQEISLLFHRVLRRGLDALVPNA